MATFAQYLIKTYGAIPENFKGNPNLNKEFTPPGEEKPVTQEENLFESEDPNFQYAKTEQEGLEGIRYGFGSNYMDYLSQPGRSGGGTGSSIVGPGGGGAGGGGGSPFSGGQFFAGVGPGAEAPKEGEIDYNRLAQMLGIRGGATGIAAQGIREQQDRMNRLQKYEDEKFRLLGQQEKLAGMDPAVQEYMRRQARESIRSGQAARGIATSGVALEEEAYIMPQVEQSIRDWTRQALASISGQIDPLIMSTMNSAAMYNVVGG